MHIFLNVLSYTLISNLVICVLFKLWNCTIVGECVHLPILTPKLLLFSHVSAVTWIHFIACEASYYMRFRRKQV